VKKIEDMFIRFDMIYERDRHTHRQTDTHIQTDSGVFRRGLVGVNPPPPMT